MRRALEVSDYGATRRARLPPMSCAEEHCARGISGSLAEARYPQLSPRTGFLTTHLRAEENESDVSRNFVLVEFAHGAGSLKTEVAVVADS